MEKEINKGNKNGHMIGKCIFVHAMHLQRKRVRVEFGMKNEGNESEVCGFWALPSVIKKRVVNRVSSESAYQLIKMVV